MKRKTSRASKRPAPHPVAAFFLTARGILATLVTVGVLAGMVIGVDTRYAKAENVSRQIQRLNTNVEMLGHATRKANLEDKLFELQQKPPAHRTPRDQALIDRYSRELDDVNRKIDRLEGK